MLKEGLDGADNIPHLQCVLCFKNTIKISISLLETGQAWRCTLCTDIYYFRTDRCLLFLIQINYFHTDIYYVHINRLLHSGLFVLLFCLVLLKSFIS